jgi:hypothetical protein
MGGFGEKRKGSGDGDWKDQTWLRWWRGLDGACLCLERDELVEERPLARRVRWD